MNLVEMSDSRSSSNSPPKVQVPPIASISKEKIAAHEKIERERNGCCARCFHAVEIGEHNPYLVTCGEDGDVTLPGAITCVGVVFVILVLCLVWVLVRS